jgi:predicted kinase
MKQPKFIMMCGLPASSKSTFAQELAKVENAIVLSSDQMRLELYGDETDQEHNGEIFNEIYRRAIRHLKNQKSIIIDATNIASKKE